MQCLLDGLIRDDSQERRLFELHRQSLAKRLIKDGISDLILKFGQNDRVFCRQLLGTM
jgi:hypothetical protein